MLRVLVVEDNPADAYLINEAFGECGHKCQVTIVDSHEQAEQILSAEKFDLLLSDFGTDYAEAQPSSVPPTVRKRQSKASCASAA